MSRGQVEIVGFELLGMNVVRQIQKLNEQEVSRGLTDAGSWHDQYKHSPYIFIGGLPFDLNEGDIVSIFEQYGRVVDVNLVRDKETGKSRGFAFIAYKDQRSTILAVDNFNGTNILNRVIRVDHVEKYRPPKEDENEEADRSKMDFYKVASGDLLQPPEDYNPIRSMLTPESTGINEEALRDAEVEAEFINQNRVMGEAKKTQASKDERKSRLKALKRSMTEEQWIEYKRVEREKRHKPKPQ